MVKFLFWTCDIFTDQWFILSDNVKRFNSVVGHNTLFEFNYFDKDFGENTFYDIFGIAWSRADMNSFQIKILVNLLFMIKIIILQMVLMKNIILYHLIIYQLMWVIHKCELFIWKLSTSNVFTYNF